MENKKATKLIEKILQDLNTSGIVKDSVTEDLKELRTYALEAKIPLAVKVLRLTYEHIEENDSFLIPIPDDEPIEKEEEEVNEEEVIIEEETALNPAESLSYLVSLFKDLNNKMNLMDLSDYRDALISF